jgi:hypothetical protein
MVVGYYHEEMFGDRRGFIRNAHGVLTNFRRFVRGLESPGALQSKDGTLECTIPPPVRWGRASFLAIADETGEWVAGGVGTHNAYAVTRNVPRWTDTEIEVAGFNGAYGKSSGILNN